LIGKCSSSAGTVNGRFPPFAIVPAQPNFLPYVNCLRRFALYLCLRPLVRRGVDPIAARKAARQPEQKTPTFAEIADDLIAEKERGWKHPGSVKMWRLTVRAHCDKLAKLPVDAIDVPLVLDALKRAQKKHPGGTIVRDRVRRVIEGVLDAAKAKGFRSGENPAAWRGNLALLGLAKSKPSGHHPAMAYADVAAFDAKLRDYGATAGAATALEFLILTATRANEATGARWREIDLDKAVWTIPAERMKAAVEFRVPLSPRCIEILKAQAAARSRAYVFPGQNRSKAFSHSALGAVLKRLGVEGATVHGFRSSFRDWCGEETATPREVAEACLAHAVGSSVERSYRRGDALEKRRALMDAWGAYLDGAQAANVVPLRA
jgi:integrase